MGPQANIAETVAEGIEYLDPQAQPGASPTPYTARMQPDSKPLVIGLLSNLFADASVFLRDLKEPLTELLPGVEFRFYDKGTVQRMSFPVTNEVRQEITSECHAVICAYGHCGSCTSGTTQDALGFAAVNFPAVALVTEKFKEEALFLARAGGIPDVPFVFLPHPVAGKSASYHRALAKIIAPAVVAALVKGQISDMAADRPEALH